MIMEDKHYAMLASYVKEMVNSGRLDRISLVEFGRVFARYVETLELEAERDARDKANGKGE